MTLSDGDLARVLARIDRVNAEDPVQVVVDGVSRPKEVVHAEVMTRWVLHLDPRADAAQRIAARAHHLRRWVSPRQSYPDGRAGYLRWRRDQRARQQAELQILLEDERVGPTTVREAVRIVGKEGLGRDPKVQVHEDALCLTFLELQLDETLSSLGEDRVVEIVAKTLPKMSDAGRAATAALPLSPAGADALARAVARWSDAQGD